MEASQYRGSSNSDAPEKDASFNLSAPAITLPKGGGAIRGIGEKFAANPVTGTGSMTVPIATSPGRSGFGPQLALSYDSGAGNGPFGFGWHLPLPSITRKTDKGLPRYLDAQESDVFLLSGAEDLVPLLNADGTRHSDTVSAPGYTIHRYRPRIEGLFARIERWTHREDGDVHWRSITRDNVTTYYGKASASRIADPSDPSRIFSWLICESHDDKGNATIYEYKAENSDDVAVSLVHERNRTPQSRSANRYLKRIRYGNEQSLRMQPDLSRQQWLFEAVFDYGEHDPDIPTPGGTGNWTCRHDPFSSYRAGFEVRTYRLCRRVLMFHHVADRPGEPGYDGLVRSTDFSYRHQQDPADPRNAIYSFLVTAGQTAFAKRNDGGYARRSLPPLEFTYSEPRIREEIEELDRDSLDNLPQGLDGTGYQWADLDGEGASGILAEQGDAWFYKRNLSPLNAVGDPDEARVRAQFAPVECVAAKPNLALAGGRGQFMDLAGDGKLDLVALDDPTPGYFERTAQDDWSPFRPFRSWPNVDLRDPNLRFVDLTGDGHADLLIAEHDAFVWHPSLAEDGFAPAERVHKALDEERGPRLVFADGTQSIYLADLCGDGLTSLVRIRNGEVCYWPNLGYGRFGAKVTMDNAPWFDAPDQFDQKRIRLADIDGSGTIDILYLGRDAVHIYFNESGNRWAPRHTLGHFPKIDNLATVMVVDLLGNGTACLVWSSPLAGDAHIPLRYLDLMGGQKPHLLIQVKNNLGAETRIDYAPSTRFYLSDKLAGKPWITRLPFPVHCVEKVTVTDRWRGTTFSTRYSYHHGYFDGIEREFRGFGRVEQTDTEAYGAFAAGNADSPYITADRTLYQPPVKTVSWFHAGVFFDRRQILSQYRDEYFRGFAENPLPEPDLAGENLTAEEWREALRACKGMPLRQEVYELDVDALEAGEERPVKLFTTAYHNSHIRRVQPRGPNRHAVFLVTESEAITYHYELDLRPETLTPDPRISHTLNLNIDEYGNVLQSIAVAYARQRNHEDNTLSIDTLSRIHAVQSERHLAYTEARYTNDIDAPDAYRLRAPCEVKTYELTGISPEDAGDLATPDPRDNRYFTLDELRRYRLSTSYQPAGEAVAEIAYHEVAGGGAQKRCVEHVRMLYFVDDPAATPGFLESPLPFSQQGALGLPYETYKLALTGELAGAVFGDKFTLEIRDALADPARSGYAYDATAGDYWMRSGIAGFALDAADHFFLPERYTDSFGNTTALEYDVRDLFVRSSTDPAGNTVSITAFDYRVHAPLEIKDINGNFSEVAFDVLGLPAVVAVKGKGEEGDNLAGIGPEILDPPSTERAAFFTGAYDEPAARRLLGSATARHLYYFGEAINPDGSVAWGVHPACAAAILREQHGAGLPAGEGADLQVAFEYTDGGGNVLVKKVQAEPESEGGPLRWIASGKTILNNKGKPVKQYEPYFTASPAFEELREEGVTPVMYYDAAGRLVRTEMPDGTFSRVEFSPWHVKTFDANDTVLDSPWYQQNGRNRLDPTAPFPVTIPGLGSVPTPDERAGWLAAHHANTPSETHLDSLGREVVAIAHNRTDGVDETYTTYTKLDAEGKPLWIRDARKNLVMQYITPAKANNDPSDVMPANAVPCYDIAGNLLFQHSMDAGERWMLMDAAGKPMLAWDMNETPQGTAATRENRLYTNDYDKLHRPTAQWLTVNNASPVMMERYEYRDTKNPDGTSNSQLAQDTAANLIGQLVRHYDPSGRIETIRRDFKGNVQEVRRTLTRDAAVSLVNWDIADNAALNGLLEQETYVQLTEHDALNRMTRLYNWHRGVGSRVAVYEPRYNQRGLLLSEQLIVKATRNTAATDKRYDVEPNVTQTSNAIKKITYNAKGQKEYLELGNGTITRYDYDEKTFRLRQLRTTRSAYDPSFPQRRSNLEDGNILQQLLYTYDPVGNITEIADEAYKPVYFANGIAESKSQYEYDALYRLIFASGRETAQGGDALKESREAVGANGFPITDQTLRRYTQSYEYDSVGNFVTMRHSVPSDAANGWTREYDYYADSNRMLSTWTGADQSNAVVYQYDTHGSMLNLTQSSEEFYLRWDYRDMIRHVNLGGGGQAWYNYDAGRQRTRKRIERLGGVVVEERLYLGGMELYRRWQNGTLAEEIETHHLFAGDQRLLLADDVLDTDNHALGTGVLYKYQYSNHLGSAVAELDAEARIISYEEYHPYGTTAFSARDAGVRATAKRYRYTGMERDEETGLSYHTARYYAPWLGRWVSADPFSSVLSNRYEYCDSHPVCSVDWSGKQGRRVEADLDLRFANWLDNAGVDDFFAGLGDNYSFGLTARLREATGTNTTVDEASASYSAGDTTATVIQLSTGAGAVKVAVRKVGARVVSTTIVRALVIDHVATSSLDAVEETGTASGVYRAVTSIIPRLRVSPTSTGGRPGRTGSGAHTSRVAQADATRVAQAEARVAEETTRAAVDATGANAANRPTIVRPDVFTHELFRRSVTGPPLNSDARGYSRRATTSQQVIERARKYWGGPGPVPSESELDLGHAGTPHALLRPGETTTLRAELSATNQARGRTSEAAVVRQRRALSQAQGLDPHDPSNPHFTRRPRRRR